MPRRPYEGAMSLWATVMGHTNMIMHSFGWLEGGLRASFEKIVIDLEKWSRPYMKSLEPVDFSESELAVDAMADVGPGGHFFGTQHTLDRYETAFYEPVLSDWRNFETWEQDGARDATQRAHLVYKPVAGRIREARHGSCNP